jgi:alpha-tubulin suppressor-like RCC1 family protein
LLEGGALMAWGDNTYGQLGDGTIKASTVPVAVAKTADVIAVAAGDGHSIALKADGTKMSWGNNGAGQLGRDSDDSIESYAIAAEVPEPLGWKVWLWLWDQIKALPDKLMGLQKMLAAPELPPLPPLPPIPEVPKMEAPKK